MAKAFDEAVAIDGTILTKLDGDARGGAALSIKAVVGKPVQFVGVGEKLEALEALSSRPHGLTASGYGGRAHPD